MYIRQPPPQSIHDTLHHCVHTLVPLAAGFLTSVQEFMVSSAVPLEYTWSSAAPTTPAAAAAASAPAGATTTSPDAHIAALRLAVAGGSATSATIAAGAAAEGAMLLTAARDPEAVPVPAPVAPLPPQHAALFRCVALFGAVV
jgi:hypothetical protein